MSCTGTALCWGQHTLWGNMLSLIMVAFCLPLILSRGGGGTTSCGVDARGMDRHGDGVDGHGVTAAAWTPCGRGVDGRLRRRAGRRPGKQAGKWQADYPPPSAREIRYIHEIREIRLIQETRGNMKTREIR